MVDPKHAETIKRMKFPKTVGEVRSLYGMLNHIRDHIPGLSDMAKPILEMLKKGANMEITPARSKAMDEIKEAMGQLKELQLPRDDLPWVLETDASGMALGAVVYQSHDGELKPVTFASRTLNLAESNYPTHEREMLAIYWGVQNFRHYLEGRPFEVRTDHSALRFVLTQPNLSRRMAKWVEYLQQYEIKINYIPGTSNSFADFLSRPPALNLIVGKEGPTESILNAQADSRDWPLQMIAVLRNENIPGITPVFRKFLEEEKHRFNYDEETGILSRKIGSEFLPYVPYALRAKLVGHHHESRQHLGPEQIVRELRSRCWWPYQRRDIEQWLSTCSKCQVYGRINHIPQVKATEVEEPIFLQIWSLDFMGPLRKSEGGNRWIITAIEHNTRWPIAKAIPIASSVAVAQFIYDEIFSVFGPPSEILTDRGSSFTAKVLEEYLRIMQVKHRKTSAYHPRTNGRIENFHGPFGKMIAKSCGAAIHKWDEFIQEALYALRTRVHTITRETPYKLMFGVDPKLPGDNSKPFVLDGRSPKDQAEIRAELYESMGEYREAARERSGISREQAKIRYDKLVREDPLEIGDWVLMRRGQKYKFQSNYIGPYCVVSMPFNGVYKIKDPKGEVKPDLVHRDRLKRCQIAELPTELWTDEQLEPWDDDLELPPGTLMSEEQALYL